MRVRAGMLHGASMKRRLYWHVMQEAAANRDRPRVAKPAHAVAWTRHSERRTFIARDSLARERGVSRQSLPLQDGLCERAPAVCDTVPVIRFVACVKARTALVLRAALACPHRSDLFCESPKRFENEGMFPLQAQVRRAAGSVVEEIAAIQALAAS